MIGRGRKGLSTKLHLALSIGGVQSACLSEGQRVDMKIFSKLWELGEWSETQYVIADKGYDYSVVRTTIKKAKKTQSFRDEPTRFFRVSQMSINPIIIRVL